MKTILSHSWFLIAAIWYAGNGILHDVFVIKNHKSGYDRELLRLLMDGHVLLLSGILMFISYLMAQQQLMFGAWTGLVTAVFMLVYCLMIFPFLKSIVTMVISAIILAVSIQLLLNR
jgi:hypothetical protein